MKIFGVDVAEVVAEITTVYPPLRKWLPEIWRIWFPAWLKGQIIKYQRLVKAINKKCVFLKRNKRRKK